MQKQLLDGLVLLFSSFVFRSFIFTNSPWKLLPKNLCPSTLIKKYIITPVTAIVETPAKNRENNEFPSYIFGIFFDPIIIKRRALQKKSCSISDVIKDTYKEIEERVTSMLNEKKQRCDAVGISSSIRIIIGHPADKILEIASKEKVDLIVMGYTGLKGISKIRALGSVARRVSEKAPCVVLLVH